MQMEDIMKKFLLKASMVLLLPIMLVGCGSEENKSSKESGKKKFH